MPSFDLVTASPEETRALGEAVAGVLGSGDVVSLTGDLGAGKTTFVQGAASGLGVKEPVLSPTFMLVRQYAAPIPVLHVDVYRLDRLQDVLDLGFEEMVDGGSVVFIEWGDAIEALLPDAYLQVEVTMPDGSDLEGRRLTVSARGRAWAPRWDRLRQLTEAWTPR
jgi:tRNA threonylcarbamoyladenosine biosynthesis protein TsaE